ncbi:MAG TPA: hypothetical protein VGG04_02900 [Candidatus Sulfotelmatobacter sp.]|jgi:hypothetical protein
MKVFATIILALVAIGFSFILLISTLCAFGGGRQLLALSLISGGVSLAFVVVSIWGIIRLNRNQGAS